MRIAYILGLFPVLSETFIGEEIRALEKMGHKVFPVVLHKNEGKYQPEDIELSQRAYHFSEIKKDRAKYLLKKYKFRLFRLLGFAFKQTSEPLYPFLVHSCDVAEHISMNGCTHIHAHFAWGATTYAIGASKLLGLPVSFTCHGSDVYSKPVNLALKCKNSNGIICVSPILEADIKKIADRAVTKKIFCGVDVEKFKPAEDYRNNNNKWLFIGRLIDCKGVEDIISAWSLLPEDSKPELDIVGEGEQLEKLDSLCKQKNLCGHIKFLGAKDSSWIVGNVPKYKVFIVPFRRGVDGSRDTFPQVLKEAMAMGLPILTTNFCDIPKLVSEDCAILCDPASPQHLAEKIIKILNMSVNELSGMSSNARKRAVENFSIEVQSQELTEFFHSIS